MRTLPVYMVYLWTLINIGRPQDIFPVLQDIYPGKIAAALSLGAYLLLNKNLAKDEKSFWSFPDFRLIAEFALVAVISTPFGYYPGMSLQFLQEFLIKFGLYLYLVIRLINTKERIEGFLYTIIIGGVTMGVAAVLQQKTGVRTHVGDMYDPNDLAMLVVTILPICFMTIFATKRFFSKMFLILASVFMLIAITTTQSRGGFIGLVVVATCMIFMRIAKVSRIKRIIPIAILGLIFIYSMGSEYKGRIESIFENSDSGADRILIWKRSLTIIKDHLILGVGPNAFTTAYGDYLANNRFPGELSRQVGGGKWQTTHNSFLLVFAELGLPGFIIFISILYLTFRNLRRIMKLPLADNEESKKIKYYGAGLMISLVGFLTCGFFLSQAYNGLIYTICVLSSSMLRICEKSQFRSYIIKKVE
jgi:hypothetical protein